MFVCCVFCLSLGKGSFNFLDGVCYLFNWLVAGTAKEKHTQKSKKKKILSIFKYLIQNSQHWVLLN